MCMTFFKRQILTGAAVLACFPFQAAVSSPVLVEMYTNNSCNVNSDVMKNVTKKIRSEDNIIFLSCWMEALGTEKGDTSPYAHGFCDRDRITYSNKLGFFGVKTPLIIVNGRYEANPNRVDAAINLAKSADNTKFIALKKDGDQSLSLTIPGSADGSAASGEVFVYAYAPIDGGVQVNTVPANEGEENGMIIVQAVAEDHVRPIVAADKVADWTGEEIQISFPLEQDPEALLGHDPAELGYVAVLHQGYRYGPVLALGEIRADDVASTSMSLKPKPESIQEPDAPKSTAPSSQSQNPNPE